jgi:hypothetical protein
MIKIKKIFIIFFLLPLFSLAQKPVTYNGKPVTYNGKPVTYSVPVPPPFLPTDIPNLRQWYKSDAGVTKDGSNLVSQWDSQVNGYYFTATTGTQPLWVDAAFDGRPAIRLNDGDEFMTESSILSYTNSQTFFIVWKAISGYVPTWSISTGAYFHVNASGVDYVRDGAYIGFTMSLASYSEASSTASTTGMTMWQNNVVISGGEQALTFNLSLSIFGNYAFTSCYADYLEIIYYDRELTDTERNNLYNNYIKIRYPSLP